MFAVLRFQKLKSREEISAMYIHWRRDKDTPNADPDRKVEFLLGTCSKDDVIWKLPAKVRSNAVLAVEGILSASPRYFRPDDPSRAGHFDPEKTAAWIARSLMWLHAEFGDRLVSVVHHMDEATPHLHFAVVPLKAERLCAREMFNPTELQRMQTEYARVLVPLGIQRGRKKSPAKHQKVAQYYGRVREAVEPLAVSAGELAMMQLIGRTPPAIAKLQAQAADGQQAREEVVHLRDEAARASQIADEEKRERQALQNRLRAIPLADVLPKLGYRRTSKGDLEWIGPSGRLTVKAGADGRHEAFKMHDLDKAGRGAIDLVMMTDALDFAGAVGRLTALGATRDEAVAAATACAEDAAHAAIRAIAERGGSTLISCHRTPADLAAVTDSLVKERHLPEPLVRALIDAEHVLATRSGGTVNAVFPLHGGGTIGQISTPVGVRLDATQPDRTYWGTRGRRGVWHYSAPGPCAGGRELVVLGQSPTSVMSVCALAGERQGIVPPLEKDDIGRIVYVAAEGAAADEVRGVLRAAAARGAEVVTAFDADEHGRRLGRLVHDEKQVNPAARITGVSGLVTFAGEHVAGFWELWLMLLAEGASILRERIEEARAARKRGHGRQGHRDLVAADTGVDR